jgi:hypothetical protein
MSMCGFMAFPLTCIESFPLCRPCHYKKPRRNWGTVERTHKIIKFSGEYAHLVREYAKQEDRSINSVFCQALKEFLRSRDFWPPQSGQ